MVLQQICWTRRSRLPGRTRAGWWGVPASGRRWPGRGRVWSSPPLASAAAGGWPARCGPAAPGCPARRSGRPRTGSRTAPIRGEEVSTVVTWPTVHQSQLTCCTNWSVASGESQTPARPRSRLVTGPSVTMRTITRLLAGIRVLVILGRHLGHSSTVDTAWHK